MENHDLSLRTGNQAWRGIVALLATAAAVLPCEMASGSPGDLDPAFGDVGRFVLANDVAGAAWSIEPQGEPGFSVFGGTVRVSRTFEDPRSFVLLTNGFAAGARNDGVLDPSRVVHVPYTIYDSVRQPDDKMVVVGRYTPFLSRHSNLIVARFEKDGTPDLEFGASGRVSYETAGNGAATSVVLDPDGRIVVSGFHGSNLIVLRLLPNGTFDESFASLGVHAGEAVGGFRTEVVRTDDGGYRVLAQDAPDGIPRCRVLGLTSSGAIDTGVGGSGYASPRTSATSAVLCNALVGLTKGRVLVAGAVGGEAFVTRLMPDGSIDSSFDTTGIPSMSTVTAAAIPAAGDRIVLAGRGPFGVAGAMIIRLLADGSPDLLYGDRGTVWVDTPSDGNAPGVQVNDLAVLPDGAMMAAGGAANPPPFSSGPPFVARLVGDHAAVSSPGVIGVLRPNIDAVENSYAVVTIRRVGGKSGAIAVSYLTPTIVDNSLYAAVAGEDYTAVDGQLHWNDGDTTDREIRVPITRDQGAPEGPEAFRVELHDASGGGLGTFSATVQIAADGAPAGQISIDYDNTSIDEVSGLVQVPVQRKYYSTGRVSVTLTPKSGTATAGKDFASTPVVVSWADGEMGTKMADVRIIDDTSAESDETFTVAASAATGGALIGPPSVASVTIVDNDPAASSGPPGDGSTGHSRGGGGAFGWLAGWLFVAAGLGRRFNGKGWAVTLSP